MLQKSSKKFLAILLPTLWVIAGFFLAQALVYAVIFILSFAGISLELLNESVVNTVFSAIVYMLAVGIVIGVPRYIKAQSLSRRELGLQRLPGWLDVLWAPAGYIAYIIVAALVMAGAAYFLTFIDFDQAQDVGFSGMSQRYEYILAFVSLVIIAPVAEEILFRGYLLGALRRKAPLWVAIAVTSLVFGAIHLAWNVGIDVFVLSIVLCVLRVVTGSLWASIFLHMTKNGIAFYFLFINPYFL